LQPLGADHFLASGKVTRIVPHFRKKVKCLRDAGIFINFMIRRTRHTHMKKIFLLTLLLPLITNAQHQCAKGKQASAANALINQAKFAQLVPQTSHELKYDVKFVHLNVNVERTTKYISGNVKTIATVTIAPLDTFMTLLHQALTIDSIRFNGALLTCVRQDSMVKVKMPAPLGSGSTFTSIVYYKGTPPTGGAAIGSGFSNGTSGSWGNQATWSLSESFVAYHWWPCKQILSDKIDSSWVFITTDSINKAGSNGLLKNVVTTGNKKRYEWKSKSPIAYYLVSVAVAKYREYNLYAKPQYLPNDSILIQNYVYDNAYNNASWNTSQKVELNKMPQVLSFLSDMYGMYPFYAEKYGHCMAPFSGGMEHQTMTSLGFFDYYIDAHELGHQWWGDNVTCKSWGDIWLNEGFATYTEFLTAQYLDPANFATVVNDAHTNVMAQPGGSIFFTGADTLNSNRIFSSRLTYDKGGSVIHSLRFLTNNDSLWFNTLRGFQNTFKNSTASAIDFKNYYQAQTSIDPTQFFNQWYYGQGYPTFNMKYNSFNNKCFIQSSETGSMPSATPLFITPLEYKIQRQGFPDTTVRVMQNNAVETFSFDLAGNVIGVVCDPNNWLINKSGAAVKDATLGTTPVPEAIEEVSGFSEIKISPNPSPGSFQLLNPSNLQGRAMVYNLTGKMIQMRTLEEKTSFNIAGYPEGVYIIKVYDLQGDEKLVQKIIRQ
jgi:aminopeptidase N